MYYHAHTFPDAVHTGLDCRAYLWQSSVFERSGCEGSRPLSWLPYHIWERRNNTNEKLSGSV